MSESAKEARVMNNVERYRKGSRNRDRLLDRDRRKGDRPYNEETLRCLGRTRQCRARS